MPSRWTTTFAAAFAAACLAATFTAGAGAATACGPAGYAYAGVQSPRNEHGISARLTSLAQPVVASGHVAGWVGVGAPGEGPNGSDSWIQVGLNSLPGTGNTLYYEVTRPYQGTSYAEVARDVPSGKPLKIAVLEVAGRRDHWRVWVNGRAVSPAIQLVGSHRTLTPMAMAESWDGGRRVCNRYAYRFDQVSLATSPGGGWHVVRDTVVLEDPGFRLARRSPSSFVAATRGAIPVAQTTAPATTANARPKAKQQPKAQVVTVQPTAKPVQPVQTAPQRKGSLPAPAVAPVVTAKPVAKPKPSTPAPTPATPAPAPAPQHPTAPVTGPTIAVAGDANGTEVELRLIVTARLLSAW